MLGDDAPPLQPAAGPVRCCPCNKNRNSTTGSRCKTRGCPCFKAGKKCTDCHSCDLGICENREPEDNTYTAEASDFPPVHHLRGGSAAYVPPKCASCHIRPASSSKGLCYACLCIGAKLPHRPPPGIPLASPAGPPTSSFVQEKMHEAFGATDFNRQSGLMDTDWQRWHARLAPLRGCLWDPPDASKKRLARLLATEGRRWREEQLPSERILICAGTILYRAPDVSGKDIAKTVERRMDQWEKSEFEQLVQEAERNDALLATSPVGKDDANEATLRQFRRLIDKGKVRQAVRLLTERGGGGALDPNGLAEADPAGRTVWEVLESKHPVQSDTDPSCFLDRPLPPLTQVEITASHIERAAHATKGGAGPVGGESSVWKILLLKCGAASAELRSELAAMASHIANEDVPWEQLQALRACRLIGLDKQPGVRPIGIGEVLMRIMGKAMAKAVGVDAEIVCGADQLCAGLKGGVEGAIHAVSGLFDSGAECALLVDATNAFNEMDRAAALWNVRILWPRCSRFLFNTYRGHAALFMCDQSAPLWSRQGTTQGDPCRLHSGAD